MAVDSECLQKAADKYSKAFDKAQAKGPCSTRSAGVIAADVDTFTNTVLEAVQCKGQSAFCSAGAECCSGFCFKIGGTTLGTCS